MLTYLMYKTYCAYVLPTRRFQTCNLPAQDFRNSFEKTFDRILYKTGLSFDFPAIIAQ